MTAKDLACAILRLYVLLLESFEAFFIANSQKSITFNQFEIKKTKVLSSKISYDLLEKVFVSLISRTYLGGYRSIAALRRDDVRCYWFQS